jgi:hypothetical protein
MATTGGFFDFLPRFSCTAGTAGTTATVESVATVAVATVTFAAAVAAAVAASITGTGSSTRFFLARVRFFAGSELIFYINESGLPL